MTAKVMVGRDNLCVATKVATLYFDCLCGHQHIFSDPVREGALLAGWGTLHPKPTCPAVPFTDPLPGVRP